MTRLTKAALLGVSYREAVPLKHPTSGEAFTVEVRPLSDAEAAQVRAAQVAGLQLDGEQFKDGTARVKGGFDKLLEGQAAARRLAVSLALVGEERWTAEEIGRLWPGEWVQQVAEVVYRLSGLTQSAAEIRSFRPEQGGAAPAAVDAIGDPAGSDQS